LILSVKCRD